MIYRLLATYHGTLDYQCLQWLVMNTYIYGPQKLDYNTFAVIVNNYYSSAVHAIAKLDIRRMRINGSDVTNRLVRSRDHGGMSIFRSKQVESMHTTKGLMIAPVMYQYPCLC